MSKFLTILKQGFNYPKNFIVGRLRESTAKLGDLKSGEGAILEVRDKKVAVYKNNGGEVVYLSPVCKHLSCLVEWNQADKTWDCPCHGSRFEAEGALKQGPAKSGLDKVNLK